MISELQTAFHRLAQIALHNAPGQEKGKPWNKHDLLSATAKESNATPSREYAKFSHSDERYVTNAGLVILWPFLQSFFQRLDLLQDKTFINPKAMQQAVGLLQYIADDDEMPAEYLLPLNKILCGMAIDEVFDNAVFDPEQPISETQQQECHDLLNAVIQQAPILKNISITGFRHSFLLRRGQLSIRDGHYLLRVERETHDIVFDRLPWGVQTIKLPWMQTMLQVEW